MYIIENGESVKYARIPGCPVVKASVRICKEVEKSYFKHRAM
jgi:hypothetical protein